jgi:protein-tyrosine phosphatase
MLENSKKRIDNSYWVIPGKFLAGEHPEIETEQFTRQRLRWLLEQGVTFCLDLTEPNEINQPKYEMMWREEAELCRKNLEYLRLSISDYTIPTREYMQIILDRIEHELNADKVIYLHCYGGLGRTGTVVGCYLSQNGFKGNAALEELTHLRQASSKRNSTSPETQQQIDFVSKW